MDIALILLALPVILPLMGLVTLWIKLVSRGPVIYRQIRIGRDGRPFTLFKFRTMHANADTANHIRHFDNLVQHNRPMVKMDLLCDSRLIPGGCLLRAAGIDELPQLLNILRGEMSIVGPRPCLPEEYSYFTRIQLVRFHALPGLTGIWQSQGKNLATFNEMNAMDASYVRHASPLLDLKIICQTPRAVFAQVRLAYLRHRASKVGARPLLPTAANPGFDGLSTQRLG
ncbi:MAG TPA: sugar transferase [Luteolibacter sp.]|nr:sugar transferase [Luteolibacter sp.]